MVVIYIASIDYLQEEFLEQKEKTEHLLELCTKYKNGRKYINIPLPEDIIHKHDNEIGYGYYTDIYSLKFYEEELEFYKQVAEHYDNNDFIINEFHLNGGLVQAEQLEKCYISPEAKRRVHEICNEIEQSIAKLKENEDDI